MNEYEAQVALLYVLSRRAWELAGRESDLYKLRLAIEDFKLAFIITVNAEAEKIKGLVSWIREKKYLRH